VKFLVDMNLSPSWVHFLRSAGFVAEHWSNIGSPDSPDFHILRWAADHDYILMTSDLDFGAILAASKDTKPSVLQIRSGRLSPETIGHEVLNTIERTASELQLGSLVSCDATRHRVRILPL